MKSRRGRRVGVTTVLKAIQRHKLRAEPVYSAGGEIATYAVKRKDALLWIVSPVGRPRNAIPSRYVMLKSSANA